MKDIIIYLLAWAFALLLSLLVGYGVMMMMFPLAFESPLDATYMCLLGAILARLTQPRRGA